jgi:hypothetical protein
MVRNNQTLEESLEPNLTKLRICQRYTDFWIADRIKNSQQHASLHGTQMMSTAVQWSEFTMQTLYNAQALNSVFLLRMYAIPNLATLNRTSCLSTEQ